MLVATHPGGFHADDVFAVATLGLALGELDVVRTREPARLAGDAEGAAAIDERLVQGVDANDTGQTIAESLIGDVRAMSVSGLIGAMNAAWDEELDPAQEDARFAEAVIFARGVLER